MKLLFRPKEVFVPILIPQTQPWICISEFYFIVSQTHSFRLPKSCITSYDLIAYNFCSSQQLQHLSLTSRQLMDSSRMEICKLQPVPLHNRSQLSIALFLFITVSFGLPTKLHKQLPIIAKISSTSKCYQMMNSKRNTLNLILNIVLRNRRRLWTIIDEPTDTKHTQTCA